ncbi:hypothetical protein HJG60_008784 [Phyllostomus discolor]|uniref:Uncharacterized protein n=1 Tax=Phyllostomus discolor TaxID=89673 RepID=A0A833YTC8_9CHIR|nr:hypothetical protein HJG60_008784 [Phyllostomus discolor]
MARLFPMIPGQEAPGEPFLEPRSLWRRGGVGARAPAFNVEATRSLERAVTPLSRTFPCIFAFKGVTAQVLRVQEGTGPVRAIPEPPTKATLRGSCTCLPAPVSLRGVRNPAAPREQRRSCAKGTRVSPRTRDTQRRGSGMDFKAPTLHAALVSPQPVPLIPPKTAGLCGCLHRGCVWRWNQAPWAPGAAETRALHTTLTGSAHSACSPSPRPSGGRETERGDPVRFGPLSRFREHVRAVPASSCISPMTLHK